MFLGARIWTLANNSVSVEGSDYGSILGFGLIVFSIVLVLAGEIWNIHQKGRSLFNLFWNLIPYIGFFMILWLDYPVISVKIISPSNVLALGSTLQLKATETRLNGSTNGEIVANWESSNKDIATVTSGVVTGVHSGICEITAFSGGVTSEPVILTITE